MSKLDNKWGEPETFAELAARTLRETAPTVPDLSREARVKFAKELRAETAKAHDAQRQLEQAFIAQAVRNIDLAASRRATRGFDSLTVVLVSSGRGRYAAAANETVLELGNYDATRVVAQLTEIYQATGLTVPHISLPPTSIDERDAPIHTTFTLSWAETKDMGEYIGP